MADVELRPLHPPYQQKNGPGTNGQPFVASSQGKMFGRFRYVTVSCIVEILTGDIQGEMRRRANLDYNVSHAIGPLH